ncbi:GGDEF domain-containing protein [Arsenicicoccus sp. oral taxon 190]|uniref:GGDEF domain-containing protein n=1 Tax=Arsenicicoccus sp. oral taxon 190 TaxID=1658671 RepID=UPI000679EBCC|nr:GGDEF domain-containing protein [Arsenicicoccus sp. oral taxon 190]AKT50756.1 hypothetical protein ADJ73_04535 [Arsenicicoccus sp. oral taxon 190]
MDAHECRLLIDALPLGVVVHGRDGRVRDANPAFAAMLGYTREEALELSFTDVIHPDDLRARNQDAAKLLEQKVTGLRTQRRLLTRSGEIVHARVTKSAVVIDGEVTVMVIIEDWSENRAHLDDLERAANHDALTALPNRRRWQAYVAGRSATSSILAVMDVDGLKCVNDTYGHPIGDLVLESVARGLTELQKQGWFIARVGGDEFLLDVVGADLDPESIAVTVQSVGIGRVEAPHGWIPYAASVGVARWGPGDDYEQVLAAADADLYLRRARLGVLHHPESPAMEPPKNAPR